MRAWSDFSSINNFPRERRIIPERELLIAILDRAVLDYCGREGDLHDRAKEWIFGSQDDDSLFSFESICHYLHINPSALRKRVNTLEIPRNVSQAHRWLREKVQAKKSSADFAF